MDVDKVLFLNFHKTHLSNLLHMLQDFKLHLTRIV